MIGIILLAAAQLPSVPQIDVDNRLLGRGEIVPDVAINLAAEVSPLCQAVIEGAAGAGTSGLVDLATLSDVAAGTEAPGVTPLIFRYTCNGPDGFTRVLASQNGGFLVRVGTTGGANNAIAYSVEGSGPGGLGLTRVQLLSPVTTSVGGSSQMLTGISASLSIRVQGVRRAAGNGPQETTTTFAGDYRDTLTLAVTAN